MLAGVFTVADFEGSNVLQLPGEPLEHFGTLFGPAEHATVEVSARIWAAATGRRFPEFGIGAGDAFGYRLLLIPRQRKLVLRKGDDVIASAPCEGWTSDTWTTFRLSVSKTAGGGTRVEGSASPAAGAPAGKSTTVTFEDKQPPAPGRASVWATPYSDKPVRFDDLRVSVAK